MSPMAADYSVTRNYIEWLAVLPWAKTSGVEVDIPKAKEILDADHCDLQKVKDRILDYLSVRRLKPGMKGPILCFVGPPGVGKTSLGKSIARALGRKFVRLSLGGVHDEAEIRGHRRTYIGALPGQIIQGIRRAETKDPVFMLDEIDKVGRDFRGDPSSALLEALDPEQNSTFRDNYLDVTFDLSKVLFITTANMLDPIAEPLRDRMEIIELQGYTEEEKVHIAFQYLIPRQVDENGITPEQIEFPEEGVRHVIRHYTREAGVRSNAAQLGIPESFFAEHDIHIHVPAGAIPKDGPSAGVTMATALVSLLTARPVRPLTAMTGEITLSGNVLPIGGVKEKVLAAKRAGVMHVILPAENRTNVQEDLTPEQLENVDIHYVKTIDEVLALALPSTPVEERLDEEEREKVLHEQAVS